MSVLLDGEESSLEFLDVHAEVSFFSSFLAHNAAICFIKSISCQLWFFVIKLAGKYWRGILRCICLCVFRGRCDII